MTGSEFRRLVRYLESSMCNQCNDLSGFKHPRCQEAARLVYIVQRDLADKVTE